MPEFDPDIDYYEILQVHASAHQEVIKRAYRTILGLLGSHPDLGGTHEDAVRINQAYAVLSDPAVREAYDAARNAPRTPPPPPSPPPTPPPGARHPQAAVAPRARASVQRVYCPACGARNLLPRTANLARSVCGKCHASLALPSSLWGQTSLQRPIPLSPQLLARLHERSELRLQRAHMPSDRRLRCLRCSHQWVAQSTKALPPVCPRCHSMRWSDFRLFSCRFCHHQFAVGDLLLWPYWLYRTCPACHTRHWHATCERHPLRWVLNTLNLLGT